MAQLEILQCSACGSPLAPGSLVCEYCGNKNIIQSKRNPLKIDSTMAQKYISFYSQKTKDNPKDSNALYAMGLLYLNLKNYELAQRNFKDAIDQSPLDADVYYYYALSLIAGKSIRSLNAQEIGRIEEYLNTAIQMETKCKYIVLLAVLKEEYYIENHLVCKGDSPRTLFEQAKDYTPNELEEITEHCALRGQRAKYNIDLLLGVETEDDDNDSEDEAEDNDAYANQDDDQELTEEQIEAAYNLTEDQRKQYFDYFFEPEEPGHSSEMPDENSFQSKPSYVSLFVTRSIRLALSLFVTFVLLVICLMAGWGFENSVKPQQEQTIAQKMETEVASSQKKITKKEYADLLAKFQSDSLKTARTDSFLTANYHKLYTRTDSKDQTVERIYFKKSIGGFIWLFIVLFPLLSWIIVTIKKVNQATIERKRVNDHNQMLRDNFDHATVMHSTKPSHIEIQLYIQNFLSTVVETELSFNKKDVEDLKGKTLFINNYFEYEEDEENYEESAIEYKVVILENDCVTVISSNWRVYEDISDTGTIESISYADISNVLLTEDELSFGKIAIEIPDEQVFEYQNDDSDDDITFSNNCTSDVREFVIAFRKLHIAYKSK